MAASSSSCVNTLDASAGFSSDTSTATASDSGAVVTSSTGAGTTANSTSSLILLSLNGISVNLTDTD